MEKRTKTSHFYIPSPDSFFLLQRPVEWERDEALPHNNQLQTGTKKENQKNPQL
jgi:hypothetical protein